MESSCPKCGADREKTKYTPTRLVGGESVFGDAYTCGCRVWRDNKITPAVNCLRRQLAAANAKLAEMARLAEETRLNVDAITGVGGWRPIETAPKDGRAVLLHNNSAPGSPSGHMESCEGYNTVVGEWWGGEDTPGKWMCYMDAIEDPRCPFDPTHWMPLPQPPKEADDDDA